ncbi:MAG: hypothetical protein ACI93R_004003 [Flavobacteriales bacterium]
MFSWFNKFTYSRLIIFLFNESEPQLSLVADLHCEYKLDQRYIVAVNIIMYIACSASQIFVPKLWNTFRFYRSNKLLHVYIGALVHWSIGPLVHWCTATLMHYHIGALPHWCIATFVYCYIGALSQQFPRRFMLYSSNFELNTLPNNGNLDLSETPDAVAILAIKMPLNEKAFEDTRS